MHTQATLDHLDSLTKEYGRLMRSFRDLTCSQFDTKELPREVDARKRAQQHAHAKGLGTGSQAVSATRRTTTLNLFTPKFHALGNLLDRSSEARAHIPPKWYGIHVVNIHLHMLTKRILGELVHRTVKRLYGRTNKRDATRQIGQHVRRLERAQLDAERHTIKKRSHKTTSVNHDIIDQDLEKHYQLSKTQRDAENIYSYVYDNIGDPAFKVCLRVPHTPLGTSV